MCFGFDSWFRSVKRVDRCIGNTRDGAEVLGIAASRGSGAAVGVGAADEVGLGHDAGAIMVDSLEKKPGNGSRLWRCTFRDNLAIDRTAIKIPPTGAGAVHAYFSSGRVVQ